MARVFVGKQQAQKTFVIDDVAEEKNYIACSIHVKSEIVVPL